MGTLNEGPEPRVLGARRVALGSGHTAPWKPQLLCIQISCKQMSPQAPLRTANALVLPVYAPSGFIVQGPAQSRHSRWFYILKEKVSRKIALGIKLRKIFFREK